MELLRVPFLGHYYSFIYMNDLPVYVQDADDTNLDKAIRTAQKMKEELFPAFSKVCEWSEMNKRSLNTVRTEFIIIGTSQSHNQLDKSPESTPCIIMIDGVEIRRVKSGK